MGGAIVKQMSAEKEVTLTNKERATSEVQMVSNVELFITQVFRSSKKSDCLWLVLSSCLGQKQFRKFLKKEKVEEWLSFFLDLIKLKPLDNIITDDKDLEEDIDFIDNMIYLMDSYVTLDSPLAQYLKSFFDDQIELLFTRQMDLLDVHELFKALVFSVTDIIANCFIDSFFVSQSYYQWRCMEKSHAVALTVEDFNSDIFKGHIFDKEQKSTDSIRRLTAVLMPFNTTFSSVSKLNKNDLNDLVDYRCEWLMTLLSTIDLLPIGCFLTKTYINLKETKNKILEKTENSPIIFMNRYIEVLTNQLHVHVVDEEKTFPKSLVKHDSGNSLKFNNAQKKGKDFVGLMTINRKEKRDLKAMVGFKSIFDVRGKFTLGIGLMMDSKIEVDQVKFIQKLLDYLPNEIVNFEDIENTYQTQNFEY